VKESTKGHKVGTFFLDEKSNQKNQPLQKIMFISFASPKEMNQRKGDHE